jgi:putative oxidoreductase
MSGLYATDASWLDTAARLLIVALFVTTGIRNLQRHQVEDHIERLRYFKAPLPVATFWTGIALELLGSVLLVLDWYPKVGALCLIVFTVLASALLLRFWEVDDPVKRTGMQNGLFANLAVLGGLLLLVQRVV